MWRNGYLSKEIVLFLYNICICNERLFEIPFMCLLSIRSFDNSHSTKDTTIVIKPWTKKYVKIFNNEDVYFEKMGVLMEISFLSNS